MRAVITMIASTIAIIAAGCSTYRDYLDSLPTIEREHAPEAIGIVAGYYGIGPRWPSVRWVVSPEPIGGDLDGATLQCDSWSWWSPDLAAAYGDPTTSLMFWRTSMAHEVAHCALWLYFGDGDGTHARADWWGRDGVVDGAVQALREKGL